MNVKKHPSNQKAIANSLFNKLVEMITNLEKDNLRIEKFRGIYIPSKNCDSMVKTNNKRIHTFKKALSVSVDIIKQNTL